MSQKRGVYAGVRGGRWIIAACAFVMGAASPSLAGNDRLWTGGAAATDSGWTNSVNWSPVGVPVNDGSADITFGPAPLTPTASTVDTNYSINSLTFQAGTPGYQIGSANGSAMTIGAGGISNFSAASQSIAANLNVAADQTWNVSNSSGNLNVSGSIGGTGGITKTGSGTLTLSGANTFGGGFNFNGGTVVAQASAANNFNAGNALSEDSQSNISFDGGTLVVPAGTFFLSDQFNIVINAGGATIYNNGAFADFFENMDGPGTLTVFQNMRGGGNFVPGGLNSHFNGAILHGGTVELLPRFITTSASSLGAGNIQLLDGVDLGFSQSPTEPQVTFHLAFGAGGAIIYGSGGATVDGAAFDASPNYVYGGNTDGLTPNLVRANHSSLIIAPVGGIGLTNLGVKEKITSVGSGLNLPAVNNGIVSASIVGQNNDGNFTGDYLTYDANKGFITAAANYATGFDPSGTEIANIGVATPIITTAAAYALRNNAAQISISPTGTLTVGDNLPADPAGIILNGTGGAISGGNLVFGASEGLIYTAQSAAITSTIGGSGGVTYFGPGRITVSGNNTYSGATNLNGAHLLVANLNGSATGAGAVVIHSTATIGGGTPTPVINPLIPGTFTGPGGSIGGSAVIETGGTVSPGGTASAETINTLTFGNLDLESHATLNYEFNSNSGMNDFTRVVAPGGLLLNGGDFYLYQEGSTTPFGDAGTYHLLGYSGLFGGSLSNLSVLNPVAGDGYQFSANATLGTIDLTITSAPEPSSTFLVLAAFAVMGARSRRKQ